MTDDKSKDINLLTNRPTRWAVSAGSNSDKLVCVTRNLGKPPATYSLPAAIRSVSPLGNYLSFPEFGFLASGRNGSHRSPVQ